MPQHVQLPPSSNAAEKIALGGRKSAVTCHNALASSLAAEKMYLDIFYLALKVNIEYVVHKFPEIPSEIWQFS